MAPKAEILVPGGRIEKFQELKPIPVGDAAHVVYLLWDPRNGDIRYVGQTKRPERRFYDHRHARQARCRCHDWELSLKEQGLCCEVSVVEDSLTSDGALECERWWVAYGRDWGWPLMNRVHGVTDSEWQQKMARGGPQLRKKYREQAVALHARHRAAAERARKRQEKKGERGRVPPTYGNSFSGGTLT